MLAFRNTLSFVLASFICCSFISEVSTPIDFKYFTVAIDMDQQVKYLKSIGVDTSEMNEQQIKEANTRDKVFLMANIKLVDAMEEISLEINL